MSTLIELLQENRIPFVVGGEHRHVRDGWIGIDCPWCGSGSEMWHLGISLDSFSASCWRCGRKSIGEAMGLLLRVPTPQAWGILKKLSRDPRIASKPPLQKGVLDMPKGLNRLSERHRGYLRGRGYDPDVLEGIWDLKSIGLASRLPWRIWIPVYVAGRVVSWTTRKTSKANSEIKYINASPHEEVFPIKSLLYGFDFVRDSVVICEGPSDVWKIGFGAVAVFGSNVSTSQMQLLSQVSRRIVCFDNEKPAQKSAKRLCDELSIYPGETVNVCLDSPDPGCATIQEIEMLQGLIKGKEICHG